MNQKLKLFQKTSMQSGITLVALVITIVILIILAVISINAIFGDNGLITSAQKGRKEQEKAEARERLELVLADAFTEKKVTEKYTEEEFLEKHLEEFVYDREKDAEIFNEEGQDLISLNGHVFELDRSVPQLGEYVGEEGNLPPRIRSIKVTSKTDTSAIIEVMAARAEGVKYRYSIKKQNEGDENYSQVTEKSENTNEFTGLEKTGIYTVYTAKVELIKDGKIVDTDTIDILLGKLEKGVVRFEDGKWENGKASVKILTDETGYTLQYQIAEEGEFANDDNWTEISSGSRIEGLVYGQTVYGRLWNGVDESDPATFIVDDNIKPSKTTIELSGTEGNNGWYKSNVTVTITAGTDEESGVKGIKYSVSGAQTIAETTVEGTTINITITGNGTSTITAYTVDKAGNISEAILQEAKKDNVLPTGSISTGTITYNSIPVTVTATDSHSGLETNATYKYYINSESEPRETSANNSYTFTELAESTSYTLKVVVTDKAGNEATITKTASTIFEPKPITILKEGDYVIYPSKSQGNLECRVLYDSSSGYGVQLITSNSVKEVTLGSGDFSTSMTSYNNAITTLNNEANVYNNTTYSSSARCVGSNPANPSAQSGYFTSNYSYMSSYNGKLIDTDENYSSDYDQMTASGIASSNSNYWLASRLVISNSIGANFNVRYLSFGASLGYYRLCLVRSGDTVDNSNSCGLRPCFTLKSGIKITGGDGKTPETAYTLGV